MLLANRVAGASRFVGAPAPRHSLRTQNGSVTCMAASRPLWLPGEAFRHTLSAGPSLTGPVQPGMSHFTQITCRESRQRAVPLIQKNHPVSWSYIREPCYCAATLSVTL